MASSTSSNCVDSVLNALENLDGLWDLNVYQSEQLKREYRLMRTFLLCAKIWSTSDNKEHVSYLESFMSKLEAGIHKLAFILQVEEKTHRVFNKRLFILTRSVQTSIKKFKQTINHFYFVFSDSLLQTSNFLPGHELMELTDSVLEYLVDVLLCILGYDDEALFELCKDLQEKLRFFQSLIRFAGLRVVEKKQLGAALSHINVVALNAADLFSMCWFDIEGEQVSNRVQFKISELLHKINPVDPQVRDIYIQVLAASNMLGSCTPTKEPNKHRLGSLVDALLGNLWELLNCNTSLMDYATGQMHMHIVYEGLRFLRRILEDQHENFDELPNHLKPCLLYFGAFREDQEIPIWRLMRLWIAEGFVRKTEVKSLEDIAEDYIMDLIGRSLVMVDKQKSTGGVKTCRIHDLLHEFCLRKATEENFLQLRRDESGLSNFDEPSNTRRLFIYSRAKHFQKSRVFCPFLNSLVVSTQSEEYGTPYDFSSIFRIFKLLRVLDLGKINLGSVFPGEITLLVQLRYLAFAGSMNYIPSSIANLKNLETFILKSLHGSLFLPDTLWNMQTLRYLHVSGKFFDLSLAKDNLDSSSDLCNLDTISTLELDLGQSMDKIMKKFPNIRTLKCSLRETEESSRDWNKIVAMDFLRRLESLKLSFYHVKEKDYEFNFPMNLKKLTLEAFPWSIMSSIGRLPNLEVLKLLGAKAGREEIWNMEEGEFPKLKFLKLERPCIVRWTCSGDHLPCLQKLVLESCWNLEELPSCLGEIPTLELIQVHRCSGHVGSLVQEIKEEQMNWGNVNLKILFLDKED